MEVLLQDFSPMRRLFVDRVIWSIDSCMSATTFPL